MDFREYQYFSDLCQVASGASDATLRRIASGLPEDIGPDLIRRLIDDNSCRLDGDTFGRLRSTVTLASALPDDDFDAFVCATAILIADEIQGGEGMNSLYWHWDAYHDHYRMAEPHVRATLIGGFDALASSGRLALEPMPRPDDLIGRPQDEVVGGLAELAHGMAPQTIQGLSLALHGRDADRHRMAIEWILRDPLCRMPERSRRYPAEVLAVVAGQPASEGFAEAVALLLIDAIRTGDGYGEAAASWSAHATEFTLLPAAARRPICAGFRHLFEKMPYWSPYSGWEPAQILSRAVAIPLIAA